MGRRRKLGFRNPKMFSSRVETNDFYKFENLIKYRDKKSLQEMVNLFMIEYISGNLYLSGSGFGVK